MSLNSPASKRTPAALAAERLGCTEGQIYTMAMGTGLLFAMFFWALPSVDWRVTAAPAAIPLTAPAPAADQTPHLAPPLAVPPHSSQPWAPFPLAPPAPVALLPAAPTFEPAPPPTAATQPAPTPTPSPSAASACDGPATPADPLLGPVGQTIRQEIISRIFTAVTDCEEDPGSSSTPAVPVPMWIRPIN